MAATYDYPFSSQEAQAAYDEWGCNCGPTSLAFALQIGLDQVRGKIPGFEEKRYTNPTMMKAGLTALGATFKAVETFVPHNLFAPAISLVRVQWTGPWTKPGANAKWAYGFTHWIATWHQQTGPGAASDRKVFDCNGGICTFHQWKNEIVSKITAGYPRADGGWYPTHVWRID